MKSKTETNESDYSANISEKIASAAAHEYFRISAPAFCMLDKEGNILRSSPSFREIFNHEENSLSFDNIKVLLTPKSFEKLNRMLAESDSGTKKLKFIDSAGRKLKFKADAAELKSADEKDLFIVFFENISEISKLKKKQKKQEKLLIQQSKMAAMGEMLGVIAHQWKQPLNTLAIIAQTIGDDFDHGELNSSIIENHIDAINSQILFMSATVDDFRRFFIPQKTPRSFKITSSIEEIISIINPQLKACNIFVSMDTDGTCAETTGYRNEFKQVILNLMVNAKDAILQRRENDPSFKTAQGRIDIEVMRQERKCRINITDNGTGINPHVMKKLFKPYFTTKNDSGTGIGLYLSKTIIEDKMHGKLNIENSSEGAVFSITLPVE